MLCEKAEALLAERGLGADCRGGLAAAVELLQGVLAIEIICVLRYACISVSPAGLRNPRIGAEFREQSNDERRHMSLVARRIRNLGTEPDFGLEGRALRMMTVGDDNPGLAEIVKQNLGLERIVIEHYRCLLGYFSDRDPVTSAMLRGILEDEENHMADLNDLLPI